MEPVLILTYFFPPNNLTASLRTESFFRYFPQYGIKPIVITRKWSGNFQSYADAARPILGETESEVTETGEVHRLPYKGNMRDRMLSKHGYEKFGLIRKILSLNELVWQNFTPSAIPYKNLYEDARKKLKANPAIQKVLISANPYPLFYFGYLLKKEFPRIKWYADYRDDWTTRTLTRQRSLVGDQIHRLEVRSEKKWVGTAEAIICVSDFLTERISKLVKRPGFNVANGFFEEEFENLPSIDSDPNEFTFVYTGHMYQNQTLEPFVPAFEKLVRVNPDVKIKLQFIGTAYMGDAKARLEAAFKNCRSNVELLDRVDKTEAVQIENRADALVALSYGEHKGIPGSKLYQYVAHKKPVVLALNDHGIMSEILSHCGVLVTDDSIDGLFSQMNNLVYRKKSGKNLIEGVNENAIQEYSRRYQAKLLAEVILK